MYVIKKYTEKRLGIPYLNSQASPPGQNLQRSVQISHDFASTHFSSDLSTSVDDYLAAFRIGYYIACFKGFTGQVEGFQFNRINNNENITFMVSIIALNLQTTVCIIFLILK